MCGRNLQSYHSPNSVSLRLSNILISNNTMLLNSLWTSLLLCLFAAPIFSLTPVTNDLQQDQLQSSQARIANEPYRSEIQRSHKQLMRLLAHQSHRLALSPPSYLVLNDSLSADQLGSHINQQARSSLSIFSPIALGIIKKAYIQELNQPIGMEKRNQMLKLKIVSAWADVVASRSTSDQSPHPQKSRRSLKSHLISMYLTIAVFIAFVLQLAAEFAVGLWSGLRYTMTVSAASTTIVSPSPTDVTLPAN